MLAIGRYELDEVLGEGAMGRVYRGFDPAIERPLAIKVLRPEHARDDEVRRRFLREARTAGNLSHPNIVTVFDVGEVNSVPYIAMELLEGPTLEQLALEQPLLEVADVLRIGIQLGRALDYAHQHGVVHRDIKPSNILQLDDDKTIKITDFGIARLQHIGLAEQTKVGAVLGTPHYMSPEQLHGDRVDGRSDLYSVGVLMYEALSGRLPHGGGTEASIYESIRSRTPESMHKLRPDLPTALVRVVEKLLSKGLEERFQSGAELADVLERIQADYLNEAAPKRLHRLARLRYRWSAVMVAVVATTMLVGSVVVRNSQSTLMTDLAVDYGVTLVEVVAAEAAEPMLFEDWVTLPVFVDEMDKREGFSYLVLTDRDGTVRARTARATIAPQATLPLRGDAQSQPIREAGRTKVFERVAAEGTRLFEFEAPIRFKDRLMGRIRLGVLRQPIDDALRVSALWLVLLTLVAIVAAGLTAAVQGSYASRSLRKMRSMLASLRGGQYDYRVEGYGKDEFAPLMRDLNALAEHLENEKRSSWPPAPSPTPRRKTVLQPPGSRPSRPQDAQRERTRIG